MVVVLTKPGCVKCLAAKPKLQMMGVSFSEEIATIEKLSSVGLTEVDLPGFVIDGVGYTYPAAMAELKKRISK
jgi:glutaredoxin